MRSLIIDYWIRINSSYWFVPALMCIAASALAFTAVTNSDVLGTEWIETFSWLYANEPEGARSLLATVAGSMITVAGVVFSMTLLMVSHASAQIGPRVIEGFMRDRGSQVVLGTFISTFVYCLLILRTVTAGSSAPNSAEPVAFVPHVAIIIAMLLAVLSVAVLIYFVHHVPTRINVTSVIDRIGCAVLLQLQTLFPEPHGANPENTASRRLDDEPLQTVRLNGQGGYLRVVDVDGLMSIACEQNCVLEVLTKPGNFCVRETPLVRVHGQALDEDVLTSVERSFSWGGSRSQEQDILFLIDQLTEISGRALSPGVNDQFTALACIDQMERVLREACERGDPESHRADSDGVLRVVANTVTLQEIANRFLLPLQQFSYGDALTTTHLIEMTARAVRFADGRPDLQQTLRQRLAELEADAIPAVDSRAMRETVARRAAVALGR